MGMPWLRVLRIFLRSVPPDQIPQEAIDRLHEHKNRLALKGLSAQQLDKLSEDNIFTAGRELVDIWEEKWNELHPADAEIIERYRQMSMDNMPGDINENTLDVAGDLADALVEQEEPGLMQKYDAALTQREIDTARQMKRFLTLNQLTVPPEIDLFIQDWGHHRFGKEQE